MHYNWHRHYDASLGRYTQTDPLGFVDGPSVYGYAKGSPYRYVDKDGRIACADDVVIGLLIFPAIVIAGKWCHDKIEEWITKYPPANDNTDCMGQKDALEMMRLMYLSNYLEAVRLRSNDLIIFWKSRIDDLNYQIAIHNQKCPEARVEPLKV